MTSPPDLRGAVATLRRELGEGVVAADWPASYAIGGRAPELLLAPASGEEAAIAIAAAVRHGFAVAPLGGGSALAGLGPPARPFVGLLTRRLCGIVAHAAADMTLTALAGTTRAEIAEAAGRARQRLPLALPAPARATVGGMIAAAASGPLRLGHGTVRDHLLGIAVADGEGRLVRSGGRVVKNVAGYDLKKLHTGARGTLGLIVEATFKLMPLPEGFAWVVAPGTAPVAEAVRRGLAAAQVPAVALELASAAPLGAAAGRGSGRGPAPGAQELVIAVGLEGVAAEVEWQEARARSVLAAAGAGAATTVTGAAALELLRVLTDFGVEEWAADAEALLVRGTVLPSRLPELVAASRARAPAATIAAHAGNGVLRVCTPGATPELALALLEAAVAAGGFAAVERAPRSWSAAAAARVARARRPPHPLAVRLKAALDPGSVFLPGSYLGLGAEPDPAGDGA